MRRPMPSLLLASLRPREALLLLLVNAAACGGEAQAPPDPPTVIVAPAASRDVSLSQEWVGTIEGYNNAVIRPRVQGYLLERHYQEGTIVEQGDLLFIIDPRVFRAAAEEARGKLAQAQANLEKSRLDVARYRPLVAEGAVSRQELDDAVQAERANAAAVVSAGAALEQARLDLEWTQVRAPIRGIAGLSRAEIGDLVSSATELTTMSQLDPVRVRVPISEQEYLRFAQRGPPGRNSGASFELLLADGSLWPHRGKLLAVNREVGLETGTLLVDAEFPNPENLLRPGQYARLRAEVERRADAVLVPQRAVQQLQGADQVAVVGEGDVVEIRTVKLGQRVGEEQVVEEGLRAGERVVVEGLLKVRNRAPVRPETAAQVAAPGPATPPEG
jgi:membrane fusion protein (multidrug efflux system)